MLSLIRNEESRDVEKNKKRLVWFWGNNKYGVDINQCVPIVQANGW